MITQSSSKSIATISCDPVDTSEDENEDALKDAKDRNKEKFEDYCNERAKVVDFGGVIAHRICGRS